MNAVIATTAKEEPESRPAPIDFDSWMAQEQRRVYLLCLRLLRNTDEADSATQDVFLKAFRALARRDRSAIESPERWLTTVTVNTCLDRMRSGKWAFWRRRVTQNEEAILRLVPSGGLSQPEAVAARDIARRLGAALDALPARQRSVFILRHDEGRTLDEIAGILKIDLGTVKAHMARAIRKLRRELRDLYER